ncbi:hypothetical protein F7725_002942, partial [Dissostichus mawsoni]
MESLDDNQVDWSLVSASDQEQEVEEQIEAACSLRKAVKSDVLLREKFRFSMSVLQWARSLKPAWEHLRKRNPPYGWRGLPVDEVLKKDVGTKISFYGFSTNTMKNSLGRYHTDGFTRTPQSPEINYIFIPSDLRDYVMMAAAVQGRVVGSGRDRGDSFLRSPLLKDIRTRHLYMPSTGALMLLTALHTCDQ